MSEGNMYKTSNQLLEFSIVVASNLNLYTNILIKPLHWYQSRDFLLFLKEWLSFMNRDEHSKNLIESKVGFIILQP